MSDLKGVLTIREATRLVARWGCDAKDAKGEPKVRCRCAACEAAVQRMQRHLTTSNRQLGGSLLANIGTEAKPKYTVTREALQQLHPQWFVKQEGLAKRIDELEAMLGEQQLLLKSAHQDIGALRRRVELLVRNLGCSGTMIQETQAPRRSA